MTKLEKKPFWITFLNLNLKNLFLNLSYVILDFLVIYLLVLMFQNYLQMSVLYIVQVRFMLIVLVLLLLIHIFVTMENNQIVCSNPRVILHPLAGEMISRYGQYVLDGKIVNVNKKLGYFDDTVKSLRPRLKTVYKFESMDFCGSEVQLATPSSVKECSVSDDTINNSYFLTLILVRFFPCISRFVVAIVITVRNLKLILLFIVVNLRVCLTNVIPFFNPYL